MLEKLVEQYLKIPWVSFEEQALAWFESHGDESESRRRAAENAERLELLPAAIELVESADIPVPDLLEREWLAIMIDVDRDIRSGKEPELPQPPSHVGPVSEH